MCSSWTKAAALLLGLVFLLLPSGSESLKCVICKGKGISVQLPPPEESGSGRATPEERATDFLAFTKAQRTPCSAYNPATMDLDCSAKNLPGENKDWVCFVNKDNGNKECKDGGRGTIGDKCKDGPLTLSCSCKTDLCNKYAGDEIKMPTPTDPVDPPEPVTTTEGSGSQGLSGWSIELLLTLGAALLWRQA